MNFLPPLTIAIVAAVACASSANKRQGLVGDRVRYVDANELEIVITNDDSCEGQLGNEAKPLQAAHSNRRMTCLRRDFGGPAGIIARDRARPADSGYYNAKDEEEMDDLSLRVQHTALIDEAEYKPDAMFAAYKRLIPDDDLGSDGEFRRDREIGGWSDATNFPLSTLERRVRTTTHINLADDKRFTDCSTYTPGYAAEPKDMHIQRSNALSSDDCYWPDGIDDTAELISTADIADAEALGIQCSDNRKFVHSANRFFMINSRSSAAKFVADAFLRWLKDTRVHTYDSYMTHLLDYMIEEQEVFANELCPQLNSMVLFTISLNGSVANINLGLHLATQRLLMPLLSTVWRHRNRDERLAALVKWSGLDERLGIVLVSVLHKIERLDKSVQSKITYCMLHALERTDMSALGADAVHGPSSGIVSRDEQDIENVIRTVLHAAILEYAQLEVLDSRFWNAGDESNLFMAAKWYNKLSWQPAEYCFQPAPTCCDSYAKLGAIAGYATKILEAVIAYSSAEPGRGYAALALHFEQAELEHSAKSEDAIDVFLFRDVAKNVLAAELLSHAEAQLPSWRIVVIMRRHAQYLYARRLHGNTGYLKRAAVWARMYCTRSQIRLYVALNERVDALVARLGCSRNVAEEVVFETYNMFKIFHGRSIRYKNDTVSLYHFLQTSLKLSHFDDDRVDFSPILHCFEVLVPNGSLSFDDAAAFMMANVAAGFANDTTQAAAVSLRDFGFDCTSGEAVRLTARIFPTAEAHAFIVVVLSSMLKFHQFSNEIPADAVREVVLNAALSDEGEEIHCFFDVIAASGTLNSTIALAALLATRASNAHGSYLRSLYMLVVNDAQELTLESFTLRLAELGFPADVIAQVEQLHDAHSTVYDIDALFSLFDLAIHNLKARA